MTRRTLLAPVIAAAGLLLMAGRADAHAEFVGAPGSLAPDSDVSLVMNVPHERDDATFNTGVAIQLPAGWRVVSCQSKDTWTCASASDGGRSVLRFTKTDGAVPAEDETFRFVLHTGTDGGTFILPTVQTYNTGEVVRWIEDVGGAEPAPALTVSGSAPATAPATTAAPAETTAPAPSAAPAATTAPATSAAPTTVTAATAPSAAATTTAAPATTTSAAAATTSAATTTSPAVDAITTTIAVIAPAPTSSTSDDGGSNAGVIVLVVVLAGAGAAAGFYLARRRRVTPTV